MIYDLLRVALEKIVSRHRKSATQAMPVPVINIAQMREWESATWATGQTEAEVIRRVGEKVAQLRAATDPAR